MPNVSFENQRGEKKLSPESGKQFGLAETASEGVAQLQTRERSNFGETRLSRAREGVVSAANSAVESIAGNVSYAGVPDFKKKQMEVLLAGLKPRKAKSAAEDPDLWESFDPMLKKTRAA